jgi:hypothetical protein
VNVESAHVSSGGDTRLSGKSQRELIGGSAPAVLAVVRVIIVLKKQSELIPVTYINCSTANSQHLSGCRVRQRFDE